MAAAGFGAALKLARKAKRQSQEELGVVSDRTYVSKLERGLKSPTLNKVEDLSGALGIHPLTLLTLSYVNPENPASADQLLMQVRQQIDELLKCRDE